MSTLFERIEQAPDLERAEPEWRKKGRPLDRVLFACDGRGLAFVLDSVGPITEYHHEEPSELLGELRAHRFPGVWIWEGRIRSHHVHTPDANEWDVWLDGEIRPLLDDERDSLRENDDPWDRTLWFEPGSDLVVKAREDAVRNEEARAAIEYPIFLALFARELIAEHIYRSRSAWDEQRPIKALGIRELEPAEIVHAAKTVLKVYEATGAMARFIDDASTGNTDELKRLGRLGLDALLGFGPQAKR